MQFLGTKILKTPRLILRPFSQEDAEEVFRAWTSDGEVTKYLTWTPHKSVEETRAYLAFCEKEAATPHQNHWCITLDGKPVGDITTHNPDEYHQTVGIGYCLARAFWGKGIMTEAVKEALRFLFCEVGYARVYTTHAAENIPSATVLDKCGFAREGVLRRHFRLRSTGEWVDIVQRGILKSEYFLQK